MTRSAAILIAAILPFFALSQNFEERSIAAGIDHIHIINNYMGGGVVISDFNNDGFQDIFLTGGSEMDALYVNDGTGNFLDKTISSGISSFSSRITMGAVAGDLNNDGWTDLFITTSPLSANILLLNDKGISFVDHSSSAGITDISFSLSASLLDYNLDGYLDIYIGNYVMSPGFILDTLGNVIGFDHTCDPNYLYLNNGDTTFMEIGSSLGIDDSGCALAVSSMDIDQDYDLDLYVANDFGEFIIPNRAFENKFPLNFFNDVSSGTSLDIGIYGMGIAKGDYDQDDDFDMYVTNLGDNAFFQNIGDNTFVEIADSLGLKNGSVNGSLTTGWGTMFADFDNDSYLDLFVSNGWVPAADFISNLVADSNKLYRNDGNGGFIDVTVNAGIFNTDWCRGAAYGDLDNDGDLEIIVANIFNNTGSARHALLYNNVSPPKNFIQVKLQSTISNSQGIGSIVKLYSGKKVLLQEIDGGSSHVSQNFPVAHFGLDSAMTADSIEVIWPGGNSQKHYPSALNQLILVQEQIPSNICSIPINAITERVLPTSVLVKWNCPYSSYSPYVIRGKRIQDIDWTYIAVGMRKSKWFHDLIINTTYEWQIKRSCDSLDMYWSTPDTFTTVCLAPDWLSSDNITSNSATLSWSNPPSVSYRLIGKQLGTSSEVEIDIPKHSINFVANGLSPATSYIWTVSAFCDAQMTIPIHSNLIDTFTTNGADASHKLLGSDIKIKPNPSRGRIFIENNNSDKIAGVNLYDLSGKKIFYARFDSDQSKIQLQLPNNVSNGLYHLIITFDTQITYMTKFALYR